LARLKRIPAAVLPGAFLGPRSTSLTSTFAFVAALTDGLRLAPVWPHFRAPRAAPCIRRRFASNRDQPEDCTGKRRVYRGNGYES
jgi:hypothetical protein